MTALARRNLTFAFYVWKRGTPFDLEAYRARRQQQSIPAALPVLVPTGG